MKCSWGEGEEQVFALPRGGKGSRVGLKDLSIAPHWGCIWKGREGRLWRRPYLGFPESWRAGNTTVWGLRESVTDEHLKFPGGILSEYVQSTQVA